MSAANRIAEAKRPNDPSFKTGMKAAALNDPPSAQWEPEYRGTIDAVVLVGDAKSASKTAALKAVKALIAASPGVTIVGTQEGKGLHNKNKDGIEHFGYVMVPLEATYQATFADCPSDMRVLVETGSLPGED